MRYKGNILLVDDQPEAAADSAAAIEQFADPSNIFYAKNAAEALRILRSDNISLIFLDIEMPQTDGFALADFLEKKKMGIPYIFLTGHVNFAAESYDYEPVDFITKPVDIERLGRTFEKVLKRTDKLKTEKIAVRTGQEYAMIRPTDIRCFYKERRKIWMELKDGTRRQVSSSLEELEQIFSDYGFFRSHQSFLIPLADIVQIGTGKFGQTYEANLESGISVPVSRGKYAALRKKLEDSGIPLVKGVSGNQHSVMI